MTIVESLRMKRKDVKISSQENKLSIRSLTKVTVLYTSASTASILGLADAQDHPLEPDWISVPYIMSLLDALQAAPA